MNTVYSSTSKFDLCSETGSQCRAMRWWTIELKWSVVRLHKTPVMAFVNLCKGETLNAFLGLRLISNRELKHTLTLHGIRPFLMDQGSITFLVDANGGWHFICQNITKGTSNIQIWKGVYLMIYLPCSSSLFRHMQADASKYGKFNVYVVFKCHMSVLIIRWPLSVGQIVGV